MQQPATRKGGTDGRREGGRGGGTEGPATPDSWRSERTCESCPKSSGLMARRLHSLQSRCASSPCPPASAPPPPLTEPLPLLPGPEAPAKAAVVWRKMTGRVLSSSLQTRSWKAAMPDEVKLAAERRSRLPAPRPLHPLSAPALQHAIYTRRARIRERATLWRVAKAAARSRHLTRASCARMALAESMCMALWRTSDTVARE